MGIESNYRNDSNDSLGVYKIEYKSMTEPEKDGYKCRLNPLFAKIIPDHYERMNKVERVIEEMQYRGLSYQDVIDKYNLEEEVKLNKVER